MMLLGSAQADHDDGIDVLDSRAVAVAAVWSDLLKAELAGAGYFR